MKNGNQPFCSISFVNLPAKTNGHVAVTAGHCVSDGKGGWLLTTSDVICCAYDRNANGGRCPVTARYDIRKFAIYPTYHRQTYAPHDMALVTATSPVGKTPGKWPINNWDPSGAIMTYDVFGYPQADTRMAGCDGRFNGRRVWYGVRSSPIAQPTSAAGARLWGHACGGSSGGPVIHRERGGALTSVMSRASSQCQSNGWGDIYTAVVMGIPQDSSWGGKPGITDSGKAVDVYRLWQAL